MFCLSGRASPELLDLVFVRPRVETEELLAFVDVLVILHKLQLSARPPGPPEQHVGRTGVARIRRVPVQQNIVAIRRTIRRLLKITQNFAV
jgi:hypothetical protein